MSNYDKIMKPIRKLYEQFGAKEYYQQYGDFYQNPHESCITELLLQNEKRLDYSQILDFCAGSGEVSACIQALGYDNIQASDPYTHSLFTKKTGIDCQKWSFDDVVRGDLSGTYSTIICSFAMHLCEEQKLYPLVTNLFGHSQSLVIITPHKRPKLEQLSGVDLDFEDFVFTPKGKKVFLKHYIYLY